MADLLERLAVELGDALTGLDPEVLAPDDAVTLVARFGRLGRLAQAGAALCARRVDATGAHVRTGDRTAAHLLARAGGTALFRAIDAIDGARRIADLSRTDTALRRGDISIEQGREVALAAEVAPDAEPELLRVARTETFRTLQDRARDVRLFAETDREARHRRQHAARSFRHRRDADGMFTGTLRLPPEIGAAVRGRLEAVASQLHRRSRRSGRPEPYDRYLADALAALVTGSSAEPAGVSGDGVSDAEANDAEANDAEANDDGSSRQGPGAARTREPTRRHGRADVIVHVSREALLRGHVADGERCDIEGFGPVPVSVAREILDDAFLKAVVVDGTRVETIRHFGRHLNAELRTALGVREYLAHGEVVCCEPGCDGRVVEWDHDDPVAEGGPTSFDNLRARCWPHHRDKTHRDQTDRDQTNRDRSTRDRARGRAGP